MKTVSSYAVEIKHLNKPIKQTVFIYREALAFLIDVFNLEWELLSEISNAKERFNTAEHLVHNTKHNTAKYEFDKKFYKMPSYMRRAVIQEALGAVSSYKTNYSDWVLSGSKGKPPVLHSDRFSMPTFYRSNMYKEGTGNTCWLNLFINNDWNWVEVKLSSTDLNYIEKCWSYCKSSAPTLEKRHKKYFLRFSFTEEIALSKVHVKEQKICAVDLGVNTDAVCSILDSSGTVLGREFINFSSEKDLIYRILNRIKKLQRKRLPVSGPWDYVKRLNTEFSRHVSNAILSFATKYNVDVIVFEYLDMKGKKSGSKKQKLHMWRRNGIQSLVDHKAHRCGIRISHICAKNTSKLAYDGSGEANRDKKNHSLCTFRTGKQYNCDLSASYNIGARYFIRELLKPVSERKRLLLQVKIPALTRRTLCTLDTLWQLSAIL